jgi:hypothetical protein
MKCGGSGALFKGVSTLNLGHKPLKCRSKIRMTSFVTPSKIFVWVQPYATHPLFLDNLPALRRRFRQIIQPGFEVDAFDEIVAAMRGDCLKKGDEWHTAVWVAYTWPIKLFRVHLSL